MSPTTSTYPAPAPPPCWPPELRGVQCAGWRRCRNWSTRSRRWWLADCTSPTHRCLCTAEYCSNFYELKDLLRLIRALSMNKLNVFHWHTTDSQSFPLVLPSEPDLAAKGSYGEEMKYTAADVMKVVEYGMEHGVRDVPEIDMPAHTGSWGSIPGDSDLRKQLQVAFSGRMSRPIRI